MRPGAGWVWIVRTEHHLVCVENPADHLHADRVVDETDPNLPVKVFAGQQLRQVNRAVAGEPPSVSRALIPNVEALDHAWYPGEPRLRHHDLETRMAVQDACENETGHWLEELNPRRLLRKA